MRTIYLEAHQTEDRKKYLIPDRYIRIDNPDMYTTYHRIIGKTATVVVFSDETFSYDECRHFAISYMTGRFHQWTFELNSDDPKWERVK